VVVSAQLDALRAFVAARPAAAGPASNVLVVGSGKGGAGTSVVAALVAIAAAAAGRRVLLVDADPHVGPQRHLLGVAPRHVVADLARGAALDALATPVSATLSLVAGGPATVVTSAHAGVDPAEHRALLRRVAALYQNHDLIVVDGGSRLDTVCACCETGGLPARLLVVTGTEPIALAATYALLKAARERTAALPGGPVDSEVVVNRHDDDAAQHGFAQVAQACREFLGTTTAFAGAIPDDACLSVALRSGMPLQDAATGSPAAVATHALVERLLAALASRTGSERTARTAGRAPRGSSPYGSPTTPPPTSPALLGALR
jgi:flagellar biosynthesis protein FlhG